MVALLGAAPCHVGVWRAALPGRRPGALAEGCWPVAHAAIRTTYGAAPPAAS